MLEKKRKSKGDKYPRKTSYLWNAEKENDELIRKVSVWKRSRTAQGKPIQPIWWLK
jgi:hypothetical protein